MAIIVLFTFFLAISPWRRHYWRVVKDSSNKETAEKLGVDPGYLSKIARGAEDKNGKPKLGGKLTVRVSLDTPPKSALAPPLR